MRSPETDVFAASQLADRDSRSLGMQTDYVPDPQGLELRRDAFQIGHRDPHETLEEFVGIEPGLVESELNQPWPYPVSRRSNCRRTRVGLVTRGDQRIPRPTAVSLAR